MRLPGRAAAPAAAAGEPTAGDRGAPARRPAGPAGDRAFLDELHRICLLVHPALTALDQATGDGDFGDNFCGGVAAAVQLADRQGLTGAGALAETFRDRVGGSSGPLFGVLFTALAPGADGPAADVPAIGGALRRALNRITAIGGARPGDCTLVDALAPAAETLAAGPAAPAAAAGALTAAARAAIAGAHRTAALTARRGRASYTGGHSAGVPDPGAVAVALLLTALARVHEPREAAALPGLPDIARTAVRAAGPPV
ncbi:DAK2 domain-containing protein [Streptomyces sp. NPDC003691]